MRVVYRRPIEEKVVNIPTEEELEIEALHFLFLKKYNLV